MPQSRPPPAEAFAALLDARARHAGSGRNAHAEPSPRGTPVRGIDVAMEPPADLPGDMAEALSRAYADEAAAPPAPPQNCEPEVLAGELGLGAGLTAREIERIRRSFALANHPDRAPASQRDLATRRMTVANALIDQALAERRRQGPR